MVGFAINATRYILVFIVMLAAAEIGARVFEFFRPVRGTVNLEMAIQPYMMFAAHPGSGVVWTNVLKDSTIESKMKFNNFGFAEANDFSFSPKSDGKDNLRKPGEKLVLMTGGSAVYGVGASANEHTIPSQLQRYLNAHSEVKYRVINMGMGAWIAYQQFIGLSLFGRGLDPDWVVVMDGRNDGVTACAHGSGVGNPLGWPPLLNLVDRRGGGVPALLNQALNYSALIRVVTGKSPAEPNFNTGNVREDISDPDSRFRVKMAGVTIGDLLRQLEFYISSELSIAALFNKANIIFSTQPMYFDNFVSNYYRSSFGPSASAQSRAKLKLDLDAFMNTNKDHACGWKTINDSASVFMGLSALRLRDVITTLKERDNSRHLSYENAEAALPFDWHRKDYFIDDVHFSDAGDARLGAFFGEMILSAERGVNFDYQNFLEQDNSGN